ncbi:serine-threonine phosphatase [Cryptosporidium sp. chipmunk genotype I]|uniref:serine-threonine phosphatase n=1 Tax=Cryptosporidium sp. chipmunk genotype I TaxID=1280935 RepID=UPI003519EE1F|nr:serine-threonine phosphatase [Cryptosporidium sp. chipmunk genotype I]
MRRSIGKKLLSPLLLLCFYLGILKCVDPQIFDEINEQNSIFDKENLERESSQTLGETENPASQLNQTTPKEELNSLPNDIEINWKGRVLVIGDIHGDLKSLITSLFLSGVINSNLDWAAKNTLLIQLGDVVDRGSHALQIYKLFNKLRSQAPSLGSRFVGLLGNHEIMNLCGQLHYVTEEDFQTYGGKDKRTFEWSKEGFVGKYLRTMKLAVRVNDSLYVHAGLLPKYAKLGLDRLDKLSNDLLEGDFCDFYSSLFFVEDGPLWTRDISLGEEERACKLVDETLEILGLGRMVVGHTIQHDNRINMKCNNKLVLVDTGFSEAIYGKPCMLEILYNKDNPDTFDYKSFRPYSINELQVKSDSSKPNIKYIQVTSLFLNKTSTKDEL